MMAEGHYEFMTRAELHEGEADEDPVELLLAALHLLQARGAPPLNWSAAARSDNSPTGRQLEFANVPAAAVPERLTYDGTIPGTVSFDGRHISGWRRPIPGIVVRRTAHTRRRRGAHTQHRSARRTAHTRRRRGAHTRYQQRHPEARLTGSNVRARAARSNVRICAVRKNPMKRGNRLKSGGVSAEIHRNCD